MQKIKVLVVDDSLVFRELLTKGINMDPALEVVAVAGDPYEARDKIIECKPDVMTLDIELPRMDGIEFLQKLLPQYAIATVVVSGAHNKVFDAMAAGAVDFAYKPQNMSSAEIENFVKNELNVKIKIASTAKLGNIKARLADRQKAETVKEYDIDVVAIGASTGGTEAIFDVVRKFEKDIPPTVVVQHMPPGFTAMYAERLNNQCRVRVKEAKDGDKLVKGEVLIAPGDLQMRLVKVNGEYQVECKPGEKVSGHCPSVDVLFDSVAQSAADKAIGVILTGMGADGAKGLSSMHRKGAQTIGQDEGTCIVYGMPKVAYQIGAVMYQLPLDEITDKIYNILRNKKITSNIRK